ncbi:DUF2478 domain-containing protein [Snodgrassella sp. CFCC 13594]|uniref:DUF2478 domain-containing protein n=1 Tax=Snodgrassella sp. CFCC 13594 TaxID=1775559 RepID=UPI00082D89E0|nr:DUF2478 domain-containing protein [Snodgrassella sp. CFCC 13594]
MGVANNALMAGVLYEDADGTTALVWRLIQQWQQQGWHLGGLLNACNEQGLRQSDVIQSVADGTCFSILQCLGTGSSSCLLDEQALADAASVLRRDMAAQPDLLIINKFGHAEAEGRGFAAEYGAAAAASLPVLCLLSPSFQTAWRAFGDEYVTVLPPDAEAIEVWWRQHQSPQ